MLKPGMAFPVEIYTDKRIAEFQKNNEDALKKFSLNIVPRGKPRGNIGTSNARSLRAAGRAVLDYSSSSARK